MAEVLRCNTLTALGFRHGFSLRSGGLSTGPYASLNLGRAVGDDPGHVLANHARMAAAVGYDPAQLFEVSQVHKAAVQVVDGSQPPERVRGLEADALVASGSGVAVAIRTADCLPVLLADPQTGAVAAVHAGWRGVVARVVPAAVAVLEAALGVKPERLHAALLPHIRGCCFEVGADVAEQLALASPARDAVATGPGPLRVHLSRVVHAQLLAAGVRPDTVHAVSGCTHCEPQRFFSHRRDGAPCGRHLAVIVSA